MLVVGYQAMYIGCTHLRLHLDALVRAFHVPFNLKETKMKKKTNATQRIRALIDSGYNNKAIIEKLKCKPQAVYNIRYLINKERGLGSIGKLPKPTDGIGAPPKREYTRKVKAETGIVATTQNAWMPSMPKPTPMPKMQITIIEPTLWQRIKGWFRG